jgi:two-component system CheB/CheR fusion protein
VIRRFTREAARVYHLVASDVGRPLGDIKSDLEGEDLLVEAQAVLDSLVPREREMRTAGGTSYLTRIQPYRTLDDVIDGVVLTFTDISKHIGTEAAAREARELAEGIVDTLREPLVVLDSALKVVSASRSFYRDFRVTPEEVVGRPIYELGNRQWDLPQLRELLETVLSGDRRFDGYAVEYDFPAVGRRKVLLNARRIVGKTGGTQLILLVIGMAEPGEPAPGEQARG